MQLGMNVVYDVTHNTAKQEEHEVNGQKKKLLVHRKGATRAYPPGHASLPDRSHPCYLLQCSSAIMHTVYCPS